MTPSRTAAPARVALVVLALAVVVFLGFGLRAARSQAEGDELTRQDLDRASYAKALELFRDAQRMNPDTEPQLSEGALLLAGGSPRQAARVIEQVVREEPGNSKAWALLVSATGEVDPRRAEQARAELRSLKPTLDP